jgi:LmbE family N-acetylglucosaminyl deacetylase
MSSAAATVWPPAYADAATGDRLFSGRPLPRAGHVLAVTARPGQESADLGRLLYAFRRRGASLALLSLTRGEASPLNSTGERLEVIRPWELQVAAGLLGVSSLMVADYADGGLSRYPAAELTERVRRAIRGHAADLLLVIDPAAGEPSRSEPSRSGPARDDAAVARAVCAAAEQTGVPALARMPRAARSGWHVDLGADAAAARAVQRAALAAHASQAVDRPRAQRRMDRQDDREQMRWLVPPRRMSGLA